MGKASHSQANFSEIIRKKMRHSNNNDARCWATFVWKLIDSSQLLLQLIETPQSSSREIWQGVLMFSFSAGESSQP